MNADEALEAAVRCNDVAAVRACFVRGAKPTATVDGIPLVYLATYYGFAPVLEALLDAGAAANARTCYGSSPLHCAAWNGSGRCCAVLLTAGADVNAVNYKRWTPLLQAAASGAVDCVARLLSAGADVAATTLDGQTPLTLARGANVAVVALLRDAAAAAERWRGLRRAVVSWWCTR